MNSQSGCGSVIGRLVVGGVIVAGVLLVTGIYAWYDSMFAGLRVINPANRNVQVFLDGETLSPDEIDGRKEYAEVSFSSGAHHLMVQVDGQVVIDKEVDFKSDEDHFLFTGGGVLIDEEIEYVSNNHFNVPQQVLLPTSFSVEVDDESRSFRAEDQADLDFYSRLLEDARVFTKPALFSVDEDRETTMPYESPPQTIETKGYSERRNNLHLVQGADRLRLENDLLHPTEKEDEAPPADDPEPWSVD